MDKVRTLLPRRFTQALALAFALGFTTAAAAGTLTIHAGPPSIGSGGTNPLSIPPFNPLEYEVTYVSKSNFESNISLTPGLLFGYRAGEAKGPYFGLGGGLVISVNGSGPGVYSSVGLNLGETYKFNIEFKQALGLSLSSSEIVSPYAVRAGITFEL